MREATSDLEPAQNWLTATSLHEILYTRKEQDPSATAIVGVGRPVLSYRRLYSHVKTVLQVLNQNGVGRNDRVAMILPNGPEMATAFLSVAACATSAPLNPSYSAPEFEFYLTDLQAKALVVPANIHSPAIEVAGSLQIPLIRLVPLVEEPAGLFELRGEERGSPAVAGFAKPDDIALMLHTSGTTSRPKIVPLTQANICASAANIRATLALTPDDRCLNVMPLFHIHGLIGTCLSSMSAGASLVCTPGFEKHQVFDWITEFKPTWYSAVPTMHQAVVAEAANHADVTVRERLRFIRSSSSSLPPRVMRQLETLFNSPVIESYGMTEASHQMTSNLLPPNLRKPGSVGVAAGPRVAVMNETGELLGTNEVGEVVIQGDNVTRGYENDPEANAVAFTNGFFRTGDQGYMDADGYLFITGRLKEIINRGGEKVAPREIDEALLDHPAVVQATAFAVPHPTLGEDVAAAVVLAPGVAPVGEKELRDFVFGRLAPFKVPSQIVVVDEIPRGATGKLRRIGLAEKLGRRPCSRSTLVR